MTKIDLPITDAECIHLELFFKGGGSKCIETKRCRTLRVPDDVVDVAFTPLFNDYAGQPRRWKQGWAEKKSDLVLKDEASCVLA